ncbi:kinase-associated lipoprotein B [Metabacillus iocasae]|uniref:Kinase-associated protein B n=1 Tax=Priestia iocasae TaxID=2291674 RepID=A0ABS2QYW8_9BACI|nr:kinase-associated lipoprotein B [Metabacillus iocasae]MBM7704630.1 kinase-associated protein B [Metabacillus iocasae]
MNKTELKIGDTVSAIYKTGKYIGEITAIRDQHYVVRVKAVLRHPQQGDLHNPKQTDVPFFHERRALAFREQANIPKQMVHLYEEDVPDYESSLKGAIDALYESLEQDDSEYAKQSQQRLNSLKADYFRA